MHGGALYETAEILEERYDVEMEDCPLGEHNILQKKIIEDFLPRFSAGCSVLYIGDTAHKLLHIDEDSLKKLSFFELSHDELPDVIAYTSANNWLFLIEAVHSAGPMSEIRVRELKKLLQNCTADLIFVTAFLKRDDFRKWSADIAWETEVWIADNPDHLIHFNGSKFLGPYRE
jgi:type II restriction enzyme